MLAETSAAGLMLGRGAITDPLLFRRSRGEANPEPGPTERWAELGCYLREMATRYGRVFCGDTQVLKEIAYLDDPERAKPLKALKRAKSLWEFEAALNVLGCAAKVISEVALEIETKRMS
ncbi:hypothetical protein [Geobacter sp. SVR]|uniref:hypothetical protein n=1 Tax=Geobacter sp. SVR TaxID=2495594 RepID=UPI00156411B9|nr:hypothetical protein [Geobacter sp. SVR]